MNRVDHLREVIKQIQNDCKHKYIHLSLPNTVESCISEVYVGYFQGVIRVPKPFTSIKTEMLLKCTECSYKLRTSYLSRCPKCFTPLTRGKCLGTGSRTRYFGCEYSYYSIVLSVCPRCKFTIASDEWDQ